MDDWGTGFGGDGQWPDSGESGQWPDGGESGQWPGSGESGQWPGSGESGQWPGGGESGQWPGGGSEPWQQSGGVSSGPSAGGRKFHLAMLVYALLGGLLGALIGQGLYSLMYDPSGSNVLMVGLVLGIIAGLILLACAVCELHRPRITVNHELDLRRLLCGLLAAVAVFAAGCLCEFLYELNSAKAVIRFDDLIFAIDDSTSMADTDPGDLRYSALADLLGTLDDDKRVGLVRFTEEIYTPPIGLDYLDGAQRGRLDESIAHPRSNGSTDIYKALQEALEMTRANRKSGRSPVVVLLSDGQSQSPIPFEEVAQTCLDTGAVITTVSLGDMADEATLRTLSESTGGQHFTVEQAGDLAAAFQKASVAQTHRCLFSPRPAVQRGSILYTLLRVLFLTLPGVLIGFFILWLLDSGSATRQFLISSGAGLLSGIVMELGTRFFLPLAVVHIVSWVLYAVVLLSYQEIVSSVHAGTFEVADYTGQWNEIPSSALDRRGGSGDSSRRIDRKQDWRP